MIMPRVLPINELKNTASICKTCKESDVPIIITKNGYGEMVLMSVELYEKTMAKMQAATLIQESIEDIKNGNRPIDGEEFFAKMVDKYGK